MVKQHIPVGMAHAVASVEREQRAIRREEAALRRQLRRELDALAAALDPLDELADLLARAALLAAGYRQHTRGEWRRRRAQA